MNIKKYMLQIKEKQNDMLVNKLYDISIRLYKCNREYNKFINGAVDYMKNLMHVDFDNYPIVKGISGANVGIPFNIVIIEQDGGLLIMLNPKIIKKSKKQIEALSNCGSINLSKKIVTLRHEKVTVEYYNLSGKKITETFLKKDKGLTIQHEIDHNLGITILDRQVNV